MNDLDQRRVRADEIFFAAVEMQSTAERTAYIEQVCGEDDRLHTHVQRLLSAVDDSENFFSVDAPTQVTTAEVAATLDGIDGILEKVGSALDDDEEVGKQIGAYKLLRKIGEGGSGNVYVAEQSAPVRRIVAFKIIKRGMDTHSVIARFEAERQTLAMMEHPNIAHVYDAGETETGRPYFVMELVHGVPITSYCNANRLDLRQRLELFMQICHAIQHAHQKGVIHRDIKPSNVLVDLQENTPRPRVIDFGIAKAVHKDLFEEVKGHTAVEPFIGTPSYMSPEQARMGGVDLDTRSDIYSLGTLLYELLTGRTPFSKKELVAGGIDEMRRLLLEQEPQRPSVCLQQLRPTAREAMALNVGDVSLLERALGGDLDWVVMKALEKNRERRYETAEAFAMDISRYLHQEPVMARPPSRRYRFGKMVRRNRGLVVSVCAVLAALFAGLTTSSWLLVREHAARRRAVAAERLAEEARRSEARLRVEAEAREDIAMAAVLLNRNEYRKAERMVEDCELPVIKPSLEAGRVFLNLADWNVRHGRWEKAAEQMKKFARAVQVDKSDMTDEATRGLICVAPTLVVAGDLEGYSTYVHETISHFATTKNPIAAEHVVKICLILPCDESVLKELQPLADVLKKSVLERPTASDWENFINAWRVWAIAIFEYRQGHYAEAAKWAQGNLASSDYTPPRIAMNHLVLAMALHHMGLSDEAQAELTKGRAMVEDALPQGLERVVGINGSASGTWFDWVIAHIWLSEAESVLQGGDRGGWEES